MDIKDTQELREKVQAIWQGLEDGTVSNAVARTKLAAAKTVLDTLRSEMSAASLGCEFGKVEMRQEDRIKSARSNIRRVA